RNIVAGRAVRVELIHSQHFGGIAQLLSDRRSDRQLQRCLIAGRQFTDRPDTGGGTVATDRRRRRDERQTGGQCVEDADTGRAVRARVGNRDRERHALAQVRCRVGNRLGQTQVGGGRLQRDRSLVIFVRYVIVRCRIRVEL